MLFAAATTGPWGFCVYVCGYTSVCVYVCVCVRNRIMSDTLTELHTPPPPLPPSASFYKPRTDCITQICLSDLFFIFFLNVTFSKPMSDN